ncbi:DeoR/GlpR family DNA-binding transcription regulator [Lichenihabitans sp. PAMC28606]|uniref:DeoR/GlpR family DNA-binding transcription regulator n=1 Tax=Lichenihabitans sp. PAMC28606 TaxID=2880932 RepID=UPI001D0B8434|nr:DeoR/GlpR family DNA-binding transcription regulator [Lichenihabitans sp. PAMC28606]UDL93306.1 DeoR/GlpR family DNA-binding transcription regulator [Lichenihabitans sp. PAMC28606]
MSKPTPQKVSPSGLQGVSTAAADAEIGATDLPAARQNRLLDLLHQRGQATVVELVTLLDVSRDTIRRDLDAMEARGLLIRTHGGAVHKDRMVRIDTTLGLRMDAHADAKQRIGHAAARLIRDGETLILNGGSSTCAFAAALTERRNLTVVTNNLRLPPVTPEAAVRAIYVMGGTYWAVSQVTIGPIGLPGIAGFGADTAVIGVTGLSASGISMGRLEEATETASMIAVAKRTIVLADQSKFDIAAFAQIATLGAIQHLVTDAEPPPEIAAALERAGVQVLIS